MTQKWIKPVGAIPSFRRLLNGPVREIVARVNIRPLIRPSTMRDRRGSPAVGPSATQLAQFTTFEGKRLDPSEPVPIGWPRLGFTQRRVVIPMDPIEGRPLPPGVKKPHPLVGQPRSALNATVIDNHCWWVDDLDAARIRAAEILGRALPFYGDNWCFQDGARRWFAINDDPDYLLAEPGSGEPKCWRLRQGELPPDELLRLPMTAEMTAPAPAPPPPSLLELEDADIDWAFAVLSDAETRRLAAVGLRREADLLGLLKAYPEWANLEKRIRADTELICDQDEAACGERPLPETASRQALALNLFNQIVESGFQTIVEPVMRREFEAGSWFARAAIQGGYKKSNMPPPKDDELLKILRSELKSELISGKYSWSPTKFAKKLMEEDRKSRLSPELHKLIPTANVDDFAEKLKELAIWAGLANYGNDINPGDESPPSY